ncbi:MAG: 23S rRNA (pseudouridine(1915)-N(3))-methyltransferase RlmH [Terriglobia bacterium]
MKIKAFWVGKIKQPQCRELFDLFWSRLAPLIPCEVVEVRDNAALLKGAEKEGVNTFSVVFDEGGRQFKSSEFAEVIKRLQDRSVQELRIFMGDHDGLPEAIKANANLLVSLSAMTFPHDLARVMVAEQLYRAMTIIKGHPYSR